MEGEWESVQARRGLEQLRMEGMEGEWESVQARRRIGVTASVGGTAGEICIDKADGAVYKSA